jgi:flagellar hook assembly protein FlgD
MTTVQSTSNNPTQVLLDSVNGTKNNAKANADGTQDRFLKLLVTQMKNQDPMEPMDASEFTNQLVQFAGIEQNIKSVEFKTVFIIDDNLLDRLKASNDHILNLRESIRDLLLTILRHQV